MSTLKQWKLEPGEREYAVEPIVCIVPSGKQTYVWMGNDVDGSGTKRGDMRCYATFSGPTRLRQFARALLAALDGKEDPVSH